MKANDSFINSALTYCRDILARRGEAVSYHVGGSAEAIIIAEIIKLRRPISIVPAYL